MQAGAAEPPSRTENGVAMVWGKGAVVGLLEVTGRGCGVPCGGVCPSTSSRMYRVDPLERGRWYYSLTSNFTEFNASLLDRKRGRGRLYHQYYCLQYYYEDSQMI